MKLDTGMISWDMTGATNSYDVMDRLTAGWQFLWNHLAMELFDWSQAIQL